VPSVAAVKPPANDNEPWTPIAAWCRSKGLPAPEIQAGSRAVKIAGITHYIGFEPVDLGGAICIHPLDRIKTFEPLTLAPAWPQPKTVVLDPGHGGVQAGSRCLTGNRFEKELTLDWALRLKPLLEARGWTVFLTRTNDMDLPLAERVRLAETCQAGLFISLHFNSAFPNTQPRGLETYTLTPCGLTSTTTRIYADDTTATFPNNQHDAANLVLARRIHRHLLSNTGSTDRGIRRARFMDVLRGQNRPAVLIEGGFLSNPDESKAINTPAYRQRLAEGVARALE
jgi:N-acetylmuramoyl-L-alanine amidase